ncbi:hypothetical protein LTR66_014770 [Elasticomyces elasticus]|nr:hypothetical protein LTR66_014770 [Elasticomyces elasticus]
MRPVHILLPVTGSRYGGSGWEKVDQAWAQNSLDNNTRTNWITSSFVTSTHASKKWKLTAVYSRTEETARSFASKHSAETVYTSLDSLGSDSSIQAVYIASPNSLHYSQAKLLLYADKHVILEKPATSTVAELDDLFRIAKEKNLFLLEAYRHIQEANFLRLRRALLEEKKLGKIYGASLTYASYSSRYTNVLAGAVPNIFSLDFSGGSLVDIGVYPIAFAVAIWGRPHACSYSPFICPTGVDGGGFVTLRYDGFAVQINQSKGYSSAAPSEIYGEKGTVTLNATTDIDSVELWTAQTKETEQLAGMKAEHNLQEEAEEFARIVERGDRDAAGRLEELSRIVIGITTELRRQNGIVFAAEREARA